VRTLLTILGLLVSYLAIGGLVSGLVIPEDHYDEGFYVLTVALWPILAVIGLACWMRGLGQWIRCKTL